MCIWQASGIHFWGMKSTPTGKSPFKLQGQTLHAKTLGFIHPTTGEYLEIDAPLPEYFEHLLTVLEK